jgi:hypothetical protein
MARFFFIVMFNITLEVFQQSFITRTEPLPDNPGLAESIIRAEVEAK